MSPKQLAELVQALVTLVQYFLREKRKHDAESAAQLSVATESTAPIEKAYNGDSRVFPTRSDIPSVRTRPKRKRSSD